MSDPQESPAPSQRFGIGVLLAAGMALRFFALGRQSLWFDEQLAVHDALAPWGQIHRVVLASPPFFHYLLHLTWAAGLHSTAAWRFFPALFGAAAIPLFFSVTLRRWGWEAACWGAALLATSPFHLLFSQEARMYSLLFLLAFGSLIAYQSALEKDSPRSWAVFVIVSITGLYTHNWFVFLLAGEALVFMVDANRRGLIAFLAVAIAYVPWLPFLWAQAHAPIYKFLPRPGLREILHTWHAFIGVSTPCGAGSLTLALPHIRLASVCSVFVFAQGLRTAFKDGALRRLALAGLFIPLTIAFVVSEMGPSSVYHPGRYTIIALPAFLWVCAAAFHAGGSLRPWLRIGAAVWIGVQSCAIARYFTTYEKVPAQFTSQNVRAVLW